LTEPERAKNAMNATVYQTRVAVFLCPSDGGPFRNTGCNYRGNTGNGPLWATDPEFPDSANGIFPESDLITLAWVRDGLSHTVALSERLRGSGHAGEARADRDYFMLGRPAHTADQLLKACAISGRPGVTSFFVDGGHWWFWTGRERTLYTHTQTPNGAVVDCIAGNAVYAPLGMATARSRHPGGVHAGMADGSVRFVEDGIALEVWRGLGTRNGRELVD
jgi:prepilin-type processing-associated H-X9-DG protein